VGQHPFSDCDRIRGHVSAGLDDELSEVEYARVEAHLGLCADCRAYAADLDGTARVLRAAPLEQLDYDVVLPGRRLAIARRLQVVAAAAALAATVGLSALVGGLGSGGTASLSRAEGGPAGSASLRFPENELRMLQRASSARANLSVHARLTL
jgi:predicted anti-sigma-YlaC factor YlaD